ncbi:sodium/nucleoside cotransporter [Elysia marginata]|uniref:Sodium/nucleoside cotransporter n=1 Tax=Elysia marginata TaxID=1093978 RepID=A0AAV4HK95_9GAST|nr:sodium/nucleoside cotransporter [Elysia marginata]
MANMLAFVCLLSLFDATLEFFGDRAGFHGFTFDAICGYFLFPLAFVMGTPYEDCSRVGSLIGVKLVATPVVGYAELGKIINEKAEAITTYAMCGFSAFTAIGISLGSYTSLCPSRKMDIIKLVPLSFLGGNMASFATGAVADPEVILESIDSIWNLPKDSCRADRSYSSPWASSAAALPYPAALSFPAIPPSQPPPKAPAPEDSDSGDMDTDLGSALSADPVPPSQPPPRAPAPEDSDSEDMDTDLGSAFSADPRGSPLSPLLLIIIQPKSPPSPGPVKAAGGKRYKGLAGPPSGGLPGNGDMDTDLGSAFSADPGGCPLSPLVLIKAKCPPSPGPAKAAGGKRYKGLAGPPSGGLPGK